MSDRALRLQIVFAAIDKLTAPIRAIQAGSKGLSKAIGETRQQISGLNKAQQQVAQFRGAEARFQKSIAELEAARAKTEALRKEIASVEAPTKKMASALKSAENAEAKLTGEHARHGDRLDELRRGLDRTGIDVADLGRHEQRLADEIRNANKQLDAQNGKLRHAQRVQRQGKNIRAAGGRIAGAGSALSLGVTAPIVALGAASGRANLEFSAQMANVATLIDENRESMRAMNRDVIAIGKRAPIALGDLAESLYDIRSAGIPAGSAMKVLEGSARLGVAGLGSTKEAADLATSSINAFGLTGAKQAGVYDLIFKAVKNGKTTISQLAQGFGGVAGTVANANVPLDEYLASVAALTTTGLPAAQAHTQIRAAIAGMTRETAQSKQVLGALGATTFKDLVEKSGGMVNAFTRIRGQLKGNDAAMVQLFGSTEAFNAVVGLTGKQGGVFQSTLRDMRGGANAVDAAFAKQAATDAAKLELMKNRLQAAAIGIGAIVIPVVTRIGEMAAGVADAFGKLDPQTRSAIVGALAIAAALGPLLVIVGNVTRAVGFLWPVLKLLGPVLSIVARAVMLLGTVFFRVGLMLLTNPILLAIVAIAAAAYLIYRNWGPISAWFLGMWETIRNGVGAAWGWIKTKVGEGLLFVLNLRARFVEAGANLLRGLGEGIMSALGWVKEKIVGAGTAVIGWFKNTLGIKSPSRVFALLGGHVMTGLAQGLDRGGAIPIASIGAISGKLTRAMAATSLIAAPAASAAGAGRAFGGASASAGAATASPGLSIGTLNVHPAPGMDEHKLAQLVKEKLEELQRKAAAEKRSSFEDQD